MVLGAAVVAVVSVVVGAGGAATSVDAVALSGGAVLAGVDPRLHGATAKAITASSARILTST